MTGSRTTLCSAAPSTGRLLSQCRVCEPAPLVAPGALRDKMTASLRPLLRDVTVQALAATGMTVPGRTARSQLTVVTFHRVLPEALRRRYPLPGLVVTPEELDFLLEVFSRHYRCQRLDEGFREWRAGQHDERPRLCVTFDDGQLDNYEHARPLLDKHGVKATFFLPVDHVQTGQALWHDRMGFAVLHGLSQGRVGRAAVLACAGIGDRADEGAEALLRRVLAHVKALPDSQRVSLLEKIEAAVDAPPIAAEFGMMSWEQARELAATGHEIGSHALTHPILPRCTDDKIRFEVSESTDILAEQLNGRARSFCYPNGDCDARVIAAVRDSGYQCAVTTAHGINGRDAPEFELRRSDMHPDRLRDRSGRLSESRVLWRLSRLSG